MITFKKNNDNYIFEATGDPNKFTYLDHWAIREFSKKENKEFRDVLVKYFNYGGTLLFSYANVLDIAGNTCEKTLDEINEFLLNVGRNWLCIDIGVEEVIEKEKKYNNTSLENHPMFSKRLIFQTASYGWPFVKVKVIILQRIYSS